MLISLATLAPSLSANSAALAAILPIFATLLGLAVGSFLNVCLIRIPAGESILHPGSHCRDCQAAIAPWHNLPVLSWLLLGGRCANCHASIHWRYPLTEFATALLWLGLWFHLAPTAATQPLLASSPALIVMVWLGQSILATALLALAILDLEYFWLPDWLTLPGILLGATLRLFVPSIENPSIVNSVANAGASLTSRLWTILIAIAGAAAIPLVIRLGYWLIRRREGMGLGDAKLMAMLGAWLGLSAAVESFVLAVFAAALAALLLVIVRITVRSTGRSPTRHPRATALAQTPLPLGCFLAAAAFTQMLAPLWAFHLWAGRFLPGY